MAGSDKLSIENTEFTQNISRTLQDLRSNQEFSDVTLACEDDQMEAHRVVLASGSKFFQRIFTHHRSSSNTLVFMRGVKKAQMVSILDFLYCGEASVLEDDLNDFLSIANDLGLEGISSKDKTIESFVSEKQLSDLEKRAVTIVEDGEINDKESTVFEQSRLKKIKAFKMSDKPMDTVFADHTKTNITEADVENVMEKVDGVWSCKVCGKTTRHQKSHLRDHIKIHVQPTRISCNLCRKVFKNKFNEEYHMRKCTFSGFQENSLFSMKYDTE